MDYYQLLGVAPNCDRETLHKAFRELSIKFHPDRYTETARQLAEKRYQKMVKAFNTLKDRRLRERYDRMNNIARQISQSAGGQPSGSSSVDGITPGSTGGISLNQVDPQTLAKQHFQAGIAKYKKGSFTQALEHFKQSASVRDKDPDLFYFKGMCELKIPSEKRESVNSLTKAIQLKPREAKYHVALIKALEGFGLKSRMSAAVERALGLLPDHPELIALDQQINPEKYKKGLFGNLFGKK